MTVLILKRLAQAAVTFLVTASGVSFAGISGAFWGLIAGGLMLALSRFVASLRK